MGAKGEIIACPLCRGTDAENVRRVADIVRCARCGMVYLRTRRSKEELRQFYQAYADGDSHMRIPDSVETAKKSALRRESLLQEAMQVSGLAANGDWLDVGCGWGALLMFARELGFTPLGIEVTQKCIDFAVGRLHIPVTSTDVSELEIEPGSLKAVSIVHVLEHLPDLEGALQKIWLGLESQGLFCGIVPNFGSLCSQIQQDEWYWLDHNFHYTHFTLDTIRTTLEQHGFEVLKLYTQTGDFDAQVPKSLIATLNNPDLPRDPEEALKTINSLGLGEEIWFFARKKASESRMTNSLKHSRRQRTGIFLPCHNRPALLKECLESIVRSGTDLPVHVSCDGDMENKIVCFEVAKAVLKKFHWREVDSLGLGMHLVEAKAEIFREFGYETLFQIEDDIIVSRHYFTLMQNLWEWCQARYKKIGLVASQTFYTPRQAYDEAARTLILSYVHDAAASLTNFLISRACWFDCEPLLFEYRDRFLKRHDYMNMPTIEVKAWMREKMSAPREALQPFPACRYALDSINLPTSQDAVFRMAWTLKGWRHIHTVVNRVLNKPNNGTHGSLEWFKQNKVDKVTLYDSDEDHNLREFVPLPDGMKV